MKRARIRRVGLAALFLSGAGIAATAAAGDIQVSASVDRNRLALNDQLVLSVSVSGDLTSLPEPQLPPLPNFNASSAGRSNNLSIINGQTHSEAVTTYILTPRFVGRAVIGPITVEVSGRRYSTTPMEIVVERPSQGPAGFSASPAPPSRTSPAAGRGEDDLLVRAEVDKREAYLDEQVNLTVRFYTAVPLAGNPEYDPPQFQGFLSEDLPPNRNGQVVLNGRAYYYTEIKTALFPIQPGKATISPATIKAQIPQGNIDPFAPDFFQRFFQQGLSMGQEREIRTEPLTVRVKPLPAAGKPEAFQGAVGDYSVGAALDKRELKAGEALNLTFTVRGEGNLKTASPPKMPELPDFRVYDTVSSLSLEKSGDVVRSSKEFKTVLVPKVSGLLSIPAIRYPIFDPRRGTYIARETPALTVKVLPGAAPSAPVSETAPEALPISADIRYIQADQGRPLSDSLLRPLTAHRLAHLLPLAAFLLALLARALAGLKSRDAERSRSRRALSCALAALKKAERKADPQEIARTASGLSEVISSYLDDKLGEEARGLPFRKSLELLARRHPALRPESLETLRDIWEELSLLRFSPSGEGGRPPTAQNVAEALKTLEREAQG